jgi:hypothetical protein
MENHGISRKLWCGGCWQLREALVPTIPGNLWVFGTGGRIARYRRSGTVAAPGSYICKAVFNRVWGSETNLSCRYLDGVASETVRRVKFFFF